MAAWQAGQGSPSRAGLIFQVLHATAWRDEQTFLIFFQSKVLFFHTKSLRTFLNIACMHVYNNAMYKAMYRIVTYLCNNLHMAILEILRNQCNVQKSP